MRFAVGPERRWRLSLHLFGPRDDKGRWRTCGFHIKLRRGRVFRHFVVKLRRTQAFGRNGSRLEMWVGWFESRDGVRGLMNGWRVVRSIDRMRDYKPTENSDFPIAGSAPRDRRADFEVR